MFPIRRVLVIDDDQMLRDLLEALLPMDGYEVTSAACGEDALRTLREDPTLDLVLTDLHMPGLEGSALTDALRSAARPHTLLLGMSGSEPHPAVREALDAFLLKPFDSDGLQQAIRNAQAAAQNEDSQPAAAENEIPRTSSSSQEEHQQPVTGPLDEAIFGALANIIPLHQLGQLYEMTLTDIAKRLERIREAAAAGDLPLVHREAHSIKGSCGMVGATEIQLLAAAIEGGTTVNTSAIAQIPSACLRLRRMLDAKLQPV